MYEPKYREFYCIAPHHLPVRYDQDRFIQHNACQVSSGEVDAYFQTGWPDIENDTAVIIATLNDGDHIPLHIVCLNSRKAYDFVSGRGNHTYVVNYYLIDWDRIKDLIQFGVTL